jgi:protein O-mannosyl-transferase
MHSAPSVGPRWQRYSLFGAVALAGALAYARTLSAPFEFDDFDQILHNPAVQHPTAQGLVLWGRTRLIPYVTLALNWQVGGDDPLGYHLVNIAIHLLTTFLVFRLALALCLTPRVRDMPVAANALPFATAAAVLFACHPIQIQAVTYIVQRVTSLAALFYIATIFLYVTARNRQQGDAGSGTRAYAASLLCAMGALLCKENAATLPLAILMVEWLLEPPGSPRRSVRQWVPFFVPVVVAPLIWLIFWRAPNRLIMVTGADATWLEKLLRAAAPSGPVSPLAYFLTQCTVIPRYLALVVLPWGFNVDHDVPMVSGLSMATAGGFLLLAVLLACGIVARRRWPLISFGILWFFLTLAVESSFLPLGDAMMEHRMYLPMAGIAIAFGSVFARAYESRRALSIAVTLLRNEVWRSQLDLWTDALAKSPHKARVHANLGAFLFDSGKIDESIPYFCAALDLDPQHPTARGNLQLAVEAQIDRRLEAEDEDVEVIVDQDGRLVVDLDEICREQRPNRRSGDHTNSD